MDSELVELCPICIENDALYFTECGHKYCVCCLSRVNTCAICRKSLLRSTLCIEIKRKVKPIQQSNNSVGLIFNHPARELIWSVNPEDHHPSVARNFSRIDTSELRTYASNYDNLRIMSIMSGMRCLTYSN
jgi:hypothetical protein